MEDERIRDKEAKPRAKSDSKTTGLIKRFVKLDIKKKIQYLAVLLVIIVILAIYFASFSDSNNDNADDQATAVYEVSDDEIEEKLRQTLSCIEGAGKVEVMITYESSGEIIPAISVDTQSSTTTDTDEDGNSTTSTENTQSEIVTISTSDGTAALVLREDSPQVKGVLVIAEGADDIGVKLRLLEAVQTILDVSPDQVDVYKMNNE